MNEQLHKDTHKLKQWFLTPRQEIPIKKDKFQWAMMMGRNYEEQQNELLLALQF